jgi:hypothetical protein
MSSAKTAIVLIFLALVAVVGAGGALLQKSSAPVEPAVLREHALKCITLNTRGYDAERRKVRIDKRSISVTADEDMHIVALEHFIGVSWGAFGDNGHVLSTSPDNPWVKWEKASTGMEPTGTTGYFGYCGRDYYSQCSGIGDIMAYQSFPVGTHVLVRKGETLYLHCYACLSAKSERPSGGVHHKVEVLYW